MLPRGYTKATLRRFVGKLDTYQAGEKTLNSLQYDGVPLWWIYKIRFIRDAPPKPFDNFDALLRRQTQSRMNQWVNRLIKKIQGDVLARGMCLNERLKGVYARIRTKDTPLPKTTLFFLVHSIAMNMKKNKEFSIDRIDPVFRAAQKDREMNAQVLVIDAMSQRASFTTAGYPNFFHQYMDEQIYAMAACHASRLHQEWKEFKKKVHGDQKAFRLFEPALDFFFSERFIKITIRYYETFKKILAKNHARALVIYAPAGVLDRCAIKAADHHRIPTIALFPGMGTSSSRWTYGPLNYFLVNSCIERAQCIALGAPPENVTAIGPITFSEIFQYAKKTKKKKTGLPNILFCTAPMIQENAITEDEYFEHVRRFLAELSAVNGKKVIITVKVHPLEKERFVRHYETMAREIHPAITIIQGGLGKKIFYEAMAKCDVFVSFYSTAIYEASVMDKPVVLIDLYSHDRVDRLGTFFKNSDGLIMVKPNKPLQPVVERILNDASFRKHLEQKRKRFNRLFCYKADANAPARAVAYIKKKVEEK